MRGLGLAVALLAVPGWAAADWRVVQQTPALTVAIDAASLERLADGVRFRERHSLRSGRLDPHSRRTIREMLHKRQLDCRARRIATLSRAVFSDHDALIEHHAVHPEHAAWQPIAPDDPVFRVVCGDS
ncbi:MAG: surface-adhesin E family protein [Gammaproteobacteria bacterium]